MDKTKENNSPFNGQEFPGSNLLKERGEQITTLKEILEFDVANQLAKPLYDLNRKPPEEPDGDILNRLKALTELSKPPEFYKHFIGAAYQLDLEGKEYLIVLVDGTIMKIAAPNSADCLRVFKQTFANKIEIAELNFLKMIKENPTLILGITGTLIYRTDNPNLTPEEVIELVKEDWKRAEEIKLQLIDRRQENITAGLKAILPK